MKAIAIVFVLCAIACAHVPREEEARVVGAPEAPVFTGAMKEAPAEPLPE